MEGDTDAATGAALCPATGRTGSPGAVAGPRSDVETADWFREALERPSRYAVALADSDELVGFCGVKRLNGMLDFGYFLRRRFWGRGLAKEACRLVLAKLAEDLALGDLEVFIAEANQASRRGAAKLGWQVVGPTQRAGEPGHRYRVTGASPVGGGALEVGDLAAGSQGALWRRRSVPLQGR
ncbi:GNAT family N-acetyltransferase [Marinobacter sp.]|uniref:GNAT family N-acetyltransferase n=1 Tax=Marinobacter sp. TaxID=50741 RepID=UPI0039A70C5B